MSVNVSLKDTTAYRDMLTVSLFGLGMGAGGLAAIVALLFMA